MSHEIAGKALATKFPSIINMCKVLVTSGLVTSDRSGIKLSHQGNQTAHQDRSCRVSNVQKPAGPNKYGNVSAREGSW